LETVVVVTMALLVVVVVVWLVFALTHLGPDAAPGMA